ncbi:MAG: phospho-sugar mutase [Clostridiales bacterium]|nr:phospho-sugar mutase [Clostridiales bacterium]
MNRSETLYRHWLQVQQLAPELRRELLSIEGNEKEIEERFYTELAFGTAGLRGIIGAGTNRMNVHVVRRATAGLAKFVASVPGAAERGIAIAYDSRLMSDVFARETALVLAANGIKAYLYKTLHSVPQLSFTVRHLGCIAGVVITASHNPPAYNGYKVYWEDGGQAGPEQASAIYEEIKKADYFDVPFMPYEEAVASGKVVLIGEQIDEAYYKEGEKLLQYPSLMKEKGGDCRIVYTPLHGSGMVPVKTLLSRVGVQVSVVEEQKEPDPAFPTVKAPNPEDPNAFTLAFRLAEKEGANLILATDPDSDRLGVAVRKPGEPFRVLTGNQIGSLLLHYILTAKKEKGTLPQKGVAAKSLVSTRMADAIAAHFGIRMEDVPTGFRFIAAVIERCERSAQEQFLFGFEESFGFLAGPFVRDKDAITSAMLVAEASVYYAERGMTLYDALQEMYGIYGYYKESVKSYTLEGKEGIARIKNAMASLRLVPPEHFAPFAVEAFEDMQPGTLVRPGQSGFAHAVIKGIDVLRFSLEGGAWICIRPSGTEPKLKLYIGANAPTEAEVDALLAQLMESADDIISRRLGIRA